MNVTAMSSLIAAVAITAVAVGAWTLQARMHTLEGRLARVEALVAPLALLSRIEP